MLVIGQVCRSVKAGRVYISPWFLSSHNSSFSFCLSATLKTFKEMTSTPLQCCAPFLPFAQCISSHRFSHPFDVFRGHGAQVCFMHTETFKCICCKDLLQADFLVQLTCWFIMLSVVVCVVLLCDADLLPTLQVVYSLIAWLLVFLGLSWSRTVWDADSQQQQVIKPLIVPFNFLWGSALVRIHRLTLCSLEPPTLQTHQETKCQHRVSCRPKSPPSSFQTLWI